MRLMLLFAAVTVAVFLIVMNTTGEIWSATNAAGVVAVVVMAGYAVALVRLFQTPMQKTVAGVVSVLLLLGVVSHWAIMYGVTNWQYERLRMIRRVIAYGWVQDEANRMGIAVLRAADSAGVGIREGFDRNPQPASSEMPGFDDMGGMVRTAVVTDTSVTLTYEARSVPGLDMAFVNSDGRRGFFEHRVTVTKGGVAYVIAN
jgi:hypothetical protein